MADRLKPVRFREEWPRAATLLRSLVIVAAISGRQLLADAVVIANRTPAQVEVKAIEGGQTGPARCLEPGEAVSIRFDNRSSIEFSAEKEPRRYSVTANSAYFIYRDKKTDQLHLRRIGVGDVADDDATPPDQIARAPAAPQAPAAEPRRETSADLLTIRVKLLADEEERATRPMWEERLRRRLAVASDFFERTARLRFEVAAVDVWKSDDALKDFEDSLRDFERQVRPHPAELAIGFTSQYEIPHGRTTLGGTHGPLKSHILIREWSQHVSEPERTEILIHELGHFVGAVHSPEPESVMRPVLGDRKALARQFQIHIDPLNLLAICLVTDELRERRARDASRFAEARRRKLGDIYRVLGEALPDDPAAGEYLRRVSRPRGQGPRASDAVPAARAENRAALKQAAREILRTIVAAAEANQALPEVQPSGGEEACRRAGDSLTEHYVKVAAAAATDQPADERRHAFLLALATAIDTSDWLRKTPVVGGVLREIEPDDQRAHRLEVLGKPTLRGRHDLAGHFFISAAIAAVAGRVAAESAGLAKELRDSDGGSGFSFRDWAADLSGIALSESVTTGKLSLSRLAKSFRVADYLPDVADLPEGMSLAEFRERFGSTSDKRFRQLDAEVRQRIADLPRSPP